MRSSGRGAGTTRTVPRCATATRLVRSRSGAGGWRSNGRVRSADGRSELPLETYAHFADRDQLSRVVLERMLAGVSTRRYQRTQEPVGAEVEQAARSTSRSAVSRTFVERTRRSLGELMSRRLEDVRLAAMMIDGLELQGRINVVALGITTEGVKIPLGLWEGSTENATVATALLSISSSAGWIPSRGCCSCLTDRRRSAKPSGRCSARCLSRDA